jgi:hypothetical protein
MMTAASGGGALADTCVSPSVAVSTTATLTDANNPSAQLTLQLSSPLCSGYYLSLYDGQGLDAAWTGTTGTTFTHAVTPGNNQTQTYTAYVAQDHPFTGPPIINVASSSSVTITDQGWIGTVRLTTSATQTDANNPSATLTMSLDRRLAAPYYLSLYDDQGLDAYWTPNSTGTTFTHVVTPGTNRTITYTAYVGQDRPFTGPPSADVRATASMTYTNGVLTDETMQRVDLNYLNDLLLPVSDAEIIVAMCDSPAATHVEGSSVCDQGLDYEAAIEAGDNRTEALKKAAAVAGASILAQLIIQFAAPPSPPQAVPQQPPPPPPATSLPPPAVITAPLSYEGWLAQEYLNRAAGKYELSPDAAQAGADSCVALATWAVESGAVIQSPSGQPCGDLPIFFPGSNPLGHTAPTTQHDWDAITGASGVDHWSPAWIQLNYVSAPDRATSGLSRSWKDSDPICQAKTSGQDCDEYPFFASAQSGPASFAGPPGASLRALSSSDNHSQGGYYSLFIQRCALVSGGADKDTAAENGSPFLVIPLPSAAAPPTFSVCGP